MTDVFK